MNDVLSSLRQAMEDHTSRAPNRPFVLLTWAQSLDGYISTSPNAQTHLSSPATLSLTHSLRAFSDSILVGVQTVLTDNPRLNTRLPNRPPEPRPAAVVLDSSLRTPCTAALVSERRTAGTPVLLYCQQAAVAHEDNAWNDGSDKSAVGHVAVVPVQNGDDGFGVDLRTVTRNLFDRGYRALMVEGGSRVLSSFFEAGLCDYVVVTVAPVILGTGVRAVVQVGCTSQHSIEADENSQEGTQSTCIPQVRKPRWTQLGPDMVFSGVVERNGC